MKPFDTNDGRVARGAIAGLTVALALLGLYAAALAAGARGAWDTTNLLLSPGAAVATAIVVLLVHFLPTRRRAA